MENVPMSAQITCSKLKMIQSISPLPATVSCAKNAWKSALMPPLTLELKKAQYADIKGIYWAIKIDTRKIE